jgi:uncharacterized OB-fold protein
MTESATMFTGAGPEQVYRAALTAGSFQIQRCGACDKHVFYPRVICSHCGSPSLSWVTPSGDGTVYSTTVVRRKADAGGDLNVALIDLAEGVRMMSRVEGVRPDLVTIGMAVKAAIIIENAEPLVVFTQAGGAR